MSLFLWSASCALAASPDHAAPFPPLRLNGCPTTGAIGPFEGMGHLLALVDHTPRRPLRHCLLVLLQALLRPRAAAPPLTVAGAGRLDEQPPPLCHLPFAPVALFLLMYIHGVAACAFPPCPSSHTCVPKKMHTHARTHTLAHADASASLGPRRCSSCGQDDAAAGVCGPCCARQWVHAAGQGRFAAAG